MVVGADMVTDRSERVAGFTTPPGGGGAATAVADVVSRAAPTPASAHPARFAPSRIVSPWAMSLACCSSVFIVLGPFVRSIRMLRARVPLQPSCLQPRRKSGGGCPLGFTRQFSNMRANDADHAWARALRV